MVLTFPKNTGQKAGFMPLIFASVEDGSHEFSSSNDGESNKTYQFHKIIIRISSSYFRNLESRFPKK
jgi:hypothetical protein